MVNTADVREFVKDTEATIARAKAAKGTGTFTRFHAGSYFYVDGNDTVWHIFYRSERKEWVVCDYAKDDNANSDNGSTSLIGTDGLVIPDSWLRNPTVYLSLLLPISDDADDVLFSDCPHTISYTTTIY